MEGVGGRARAAVRTCSVCSARVTRRRRLLELAMKPLRLQMMVVVIGPRHCVQK